MKYRWTVIWAVWVVWLIHSPFSCPSVYWQSSSMFLSSVCRLFLLHSRFGFAGANPSSHLAKMGQTPHCRTRKKDRQTTHYTHTYRQFRVTNTNGGGQWLHLCGPQSCGLAACEAPQQDAEDHREASWELNRWTHLWGIFLKWRLTETPPTLASDRLRG